MSALTHICSCYDSALSTHARLCVCRVPFQTQKMHLTPSRIATVAWYVSSTHICSCCCNALSTHARVLVCLVLFHTQADASNPFQNYKICVVTHKLATFTPMPVGYIWCVTLVEKRKQLLHVDE